MFNKQFSISIFTFLALVGFSVGINAQSIYTEVDFSEVQRPWEGFGVNYVETAQTRDYANNPEDYGGFSTLSEEERQEVLQMIFGEDGLKPGVIKMFLDPYHEGLTIEGNDNDDPYVINMENFDHEKTTKWMRYFVRNGLEISGDRSKDMEIITTMYGPPAWATEQKFIRGRDLDPSKKYEVGEYMVSWVKYLKENGYPVKYLSLHNEGEDRHRWPADGKGPGTPDHDHNMYWPPEQVVDFLHFMPTMLEHHGVGDVGITSGETTNFKYFAIKGYASAIAMDPLAFKNIDLVTSHSFYSQTPSGTELLRWRDIQNKTGRKLRTWTTSATWADMNTDFLVNFHKDIYIVGVSAVIPWACIQTEWIGGDPNPGTAFKVDDGDYKVMPGYHYYKQLSRAGQPGMGVTNVISSDEDVYLIGFAGEDTDNPDSFVVINDSDQAKTFPIAVKGSQADAFEVYRTSTDEQYKALGKMKVKKGAIQYTAPPKSATTFFGNDK